MNKKMTTRSTTPTSKILKTGWTLGAGSALVGRSCSGRVEGIVVSSSMMLFRVDSCLEVTNSSQKHSLLQPFGVNYCELIRRNANFMAFHCPEGKHC